MSNDVKAKFRMFRSSKSGYYYWQDNDSGKQGTLGTPDKSEAQRLVHAKNESYRTPTSAINLQIARAYLNAADPKLITRTWQQVMEQIVSEKNGETGVRWATAIRDKNFDALRKLAILETRADHFLAVLADRKVSTNYYLRRIHNYALAMDWLLKSIIPKRQWPKVTHASKRAITEEEHQKIIGREKNPERRAFYELCWFLGGSQKDIAELTAEDVDWSDYTLSFIRNKLRHLADTGIKPPIIHFGEEVTAILKGLPQSGPLFPHLIGVASKRTGPTNFGNAAMAWGLRASPCIATVMPGPSAPASAAFRSDSRKRPLATTARLSTRPTPRKQKCISPVWKIGASR